MDPLLDVSSAAGAPMGRANSIIDTDFPVAFEFERLRWVDGDYDEGGAYWGYENGTHIYRFSGESEEWVEQVFVRAASLEQAKNEVLKSYPNARFLAASDLEVFLSAYKEAALWSSSNDLSEENEEEAEFLEGTGRELYEDAAASMREECIEFLANHGELLAEAMKSGDYGIEQAGHDFWLTRNRHGVGFWDRGLGEVGERLTSAAHAFGEVDLYTGDDDLIHASNESLSSAPRLG